MSRNWTVQDGDIEHLIDLDSVELMSREKHGIIVVCMQSGKQIILEHVGPTGWTALKAEWETKRA